MITKTELNIQGRRQLSEIGGQSWNQGAKLKTSVELDPNFHYLWIGFRRIVSENQVTSKKKRSSPKSEGFFWPESNPMLTFNKKCSEGREIKKTKIGGQCPPDGDALVDTIQYNKTLKVTAKTAPLSLKKRLLRRKGSYLKIFYSYCYSFLL